MRPSTSKRLLLPLLLLLVAGLAISAVAQETTAGLQGSVKDPSGAVVSGATVEVTSPSLIGKKTVTTDSGGYYRFANLPPGTYTLTVTAPNFRSTKQEGIVLQVGHLPTLDVALQVGTTSETVEVSGAAPIVDVTQSKVQTNITEDVLANVPKGRSFQSVIQFAPGARSEPLQGGYQIDGASNSENSYLVEGQETASIQTGASNTNVPMEFIQEVQVKSSGFEAEYGGALGGVVNVVQKRGGNAWHGSVFTYYQGDAFDAAPNKYLRRNPNTSASSSARTDQAPEYYQPKKDHYRIWEPGVELGGYLVKDRLWVFGSTVPRLYRLERTVNFSTLGGQPRTFPYSVDTYYSLARVDFLATQKIRLFGAWNYSYQKGRGTVLPSADSAYGSTCGTTATANCIGFNPASGDPVDNYNAGQGYVQPNVIYNTGADITLSPNLVATARYGYFYNDYQDRGLAQGIRYWYRDTTYNYGTGLAPAPATLTSLNGQTLGAACPSCVQATGYTNIGSNYGTQFDKNSRNSFSADLAYFKKSFGTHNFKIGYAMNRLNNDVSNGYNTAAVYIAFGREWFPSLSSPACSDAAGNPIPCPAAQRTAPGEHCADIEAENQAMFGTKGGCLGNWGTVNIRDLATTGKVSSFNHAFYVQDAWTLGHGVTLNLGLRMDKEDLPSYSKGNPGIHFGFGDKLAPRLGASWDMFGNGKFKVYGSFGYFYDIMKYNMPRGSFGGDWWHDCVYALDNPNYLANLVPARGADNHYCPGTGGANGTINGVRFIANEDFRVPSNDPRSAVDPVTGAPRSGVDPKLKPMKQHEMVFGADWALSPTLAFETRYARKRLDRTIEDAGVITPFGEQYYIVNPGFGDNAHTCTGCPPNPKANRRYDGIEFRLTKRNTGRWFGSASYTYSRLYGNYSGLTATDVSDGGGARNGANVDRAFDEPFMSFDSHGKVIDGPLGTDRPNAFKAYGYYNLKWWKFNTLIGGYQQWYSGTPLSSYVSVWGAPVFVDGRGNFADVTRAANGDWTLNGTKSRRTPAFSQTDLSFVQEFHVSKTNERLVTAFEANITNLFNQHSVTYIQQNLARTGSVSPKPLNYAQLETGFNYITAANGGLGATSKPILSSLYNLPYGWQDPRSMRFKIRFSF